MQPRRLYWTSIATFGEKNEPGHNDYIRREVRARLKDLIADESIKIATRERDHDGSREFTATLYVMTDAEMKEFVDYISHQAHKGLPAIL
jgi:ribulose bisphosphate carboxylase small subunit